MTTTKPSFNISQFKIELAELLARHDVHLGVNVYGDACNLEYEFYVSENKMCSKEFILHPKSNYIDSQDIVHCSREDSLKERSKK